LKFVVAQSGSAPQLTTLQAITRKVGDGFLDLIRELALF